MPYIASGRGEVADFYVVCTNYIEIYKMSLQEADSFIWINFSGLKLELMQNFE